LTERFQEAGYWLRKLQGELVLPAARTIYLVIASLSLIGAGGALILALVFHMETLTRPIQEPVPDASPLPPSEIDVNTVTRHLVPPGNIQFNASPTLLSNPINPHQVLGYFTAESSNGLPAYPNDFSIVGGKDSSLFERAPVNLRGIGWRAGLAATESLVDQINGDPAAFQSQHAHSYELQVLARDIYGNSKGTKIAVRFWTGPAQVSANVPPPVEEVTDLQRLASEIASRVDPAHTGVFFDVYKQALRVPRNCGSDSNNLEFFGQYRRAFNASRKFLSATNVGGFFVGVCDAWREAISKSSAAQSQAEMARNEVLGRNQEAMLRNEIERAKARLARNSTFSFAIASIGAFITICLFLAFLAMENHTKAVREAIEAIARTSDSSVPRSEG
jgi:hypothetical protein